MVTAVRGALGGPAGRRSAGPGRRGAAGDGAAGAASSPPAPRARGRRLREPRVVLGVLLVAVSVLAGVRLTASGGERTLVWAAARDLAPGTLLSPGDLVAVPVAVGGGAVYAPATSAARGRLAHPLAAGALLPVAAVGPDDAGRRLVTVPVEPLHLPPGLGHGDRVDVWVTPREAGAGSGGTARLALPGALVVAASEPDAGSGQAGVVLDVAGSDAATAVTAARSGVVDLVRVP